MFATTEVRWFCQGPLPPRILKWFQRGGRQPQEQPLRVDYYLGLGANDSLGIKLREGRIEIKQREAQHGAVQLGPQFVGMMERWRKWSWGLAWDQGSLAEAQDRLAQDWISSPTWTGVEKKRWLLIVRATREDGIAPAPDAGTVDEGCQVELAQIRARGQVVWSLSFEGFGGTSAGRETVLIAAAHLFSGERVDLPLSSGNSFGYPKWLAMLGQGAGIR